MKKKWSNTFLVGMYKCRMTYIEGGSLCCEWDPDVPKHDLTEQQQAQYKAGRDALVAEIVKDQRGSALIIET
jgi:hypothetical protein